MARSTITANSSLGNSAPSNLKGTIGVDVTPPDRAPDGYAVGVNGRLDNSDPGGYGMVFTFSVPARMKVDTAGTGSASGSDGKFDYMFVKVVDDPSSTGASTAYWEVWFNSADVDGADWNSLVTLNINGNNTDYTLRKRRTGDEL